MLPVFKNQFELDNKKWGKRVEANRANGKKDDRPKNSVEDDATDEKTSEPSETIGFLNNPIKPKKGEKGKGIEKDYFGNFSWEYQNKDGSPDKRRKNNKE